MVQSRNDLIAWFNNLCSQSYTKIEQFGTGAAYCLILNTIYPSKLKIKIDAKHEYEYVVNYKQLQALFDKNGITNHIPVDRLIKCKFQDNLEFLQFIKKCFMD